MRTVGLSMASALLLFGAAAAADDSSQNRIGPGIFGSPLQPNSGIASVDTGTVSPTVLANAPSVFRHATRGFMVVAPPGAELNGKNGGDQIAIQSRKGYAINIQVGDASPDKTKDQMFGKLEAKYLGEGKPWNRKVATRDLVVAGLPSRESIYETGSTRTRVIISRGQKTDFVFMFFAPVSQFEKLSTDYDWMLAAFRPSDDERDTEISTEVSESPASQSPPIRAQSVTELPPTGRTDPAEMIETNPIPTANVFAEPGYGYRLEFPLPWVLEKTSAFTNVFSGSRGTPAYDAIVAVQNVRAPVDETAANAVNWVISDLKSGLSRDATNVSFFGDKEITYDKYGQRLDGAQFVADYRHGARNFRKWVLVLPRSTGSIVHVWSYTAPMDAFDAHRPIAESILNSLHILETQG